jgi:O-antigen ligase
VIVTLRRRRRFVWLLWVLVLSGLAQTAYGSLMVLSGMELGAWGPKDAYRGFATGTFVNRNHFAGYLELCIGAAVALIMVAPMRAWAQSDWRQRLRRLLMLLQDGPLLARVAIALFFIGLILSQSRMGNVAAVAGLCAMALLNMLFRRRRSGALRSMVFVASILLIDIWLFGHWFGLEELAERYGQLETTVNMRAEVLEDLRAMIPAYATTGSGLGTFALAYPEFRSPEVAGFYDHAHNDYAQFLIETGVPGTALLAMLVLLTAGRALLILRRRRDPLARGVACGALTAMVAIGVHSAADFNLQIPANVVTLLTLMAAVWAVRTSRTERADRAPQMG